MRTRRNNDKMLLEGLVRKYGVNGVKNAIRRINENANIPNTKIYFYIDFDGMGDYPGDIEDCVLVNNKNDIDKSTLFIDVDSLGFDVNENELKYAKCYLFTRSGRTFINNVILYIGNTQESVKFEVDTIKSLSNEW